MKPKPYDTPRAKQAFTLPELMMVMMVIAVLLGMILSAIRALHRHSLRTVALSEVKGIETAWKQYYAHYQCWPVIAKEGGLDTSVQENPEDATYMINKPIALALAGDEDYDSTIKDKINPDNIPFMEFIHFDKDNAGDNNNPINPWGLTTIDVNRCYFVRFDNDGDGRIALPDGGDEPENRKDKDWPVKSYDDDKHIVHASVIVWTYNPEIHVGDKDGANKSRNDERIIGSWKD